jgi:hypothetical protein
VDVDDIFNVKEILVETFKNQFTIAITKPKVALPEDVLHIGYLKLDKIV